jgi:predicted enzyme related to lactoylglutathione lyase
MSGAINWFEIPVVDLDRAQHFYQTILEKQLRRETFAGMPMAVFPYSDGGVGGALVIMKGREPSLHGGLGYLDCGQALEETLARVPKAGGKVVMPRTDIGPPGFIAIIVDTEGNSVGLHSPRTAK